MRAVSVSQTHKIPKKTQTTTKCYNISALVKVYEQILWRQSFVWKHNYLVINTLVWFILDQTGNLQHIQSK